MEFLIVLVVCIAAFFIYQRHMASVDRESVNNVAYRLIDKHRLGHTYSQTDVMHWDLIAELLTTGQLAKDHKRVLTSEERQEISKAAGLASGDRILTAVGLYPGTKEHWRAYRAIMRLL